MSDIQRATSSARPEDLHRYRREVIRRHSLVVRAVRAAEQATAAYRAACAAVPLAPPPLGATQEVVGALRGLAGQVGDVADAFLLADGSPAGGLARVTDDGLARVILDRFPALANATVLGSLADDLATAVADGLDEAAVDGRTDLSEVWAGVPPALAADPQFARAVLGQVDPHRLSIVVDRLALDAAPGQPGEDLRRLGDLFALAAARPGGGDLTTATRALLAGADGRTAVRILRASSRRPLPIAALEAIALSTAVTHTSRSDGGHPFLVDGRSLDSGDDAILREAARVPGLALRLLTGTDPRHPDHGRIEQMAAHSQGTTQRGLAALLAAARPDRAAPQGVRSPAELELLHGAASALAELPGADLATDAPSAALVASISALVTDDIDLVVAHTRTPDDPAERRRRVESLTRALGHTAEHPATWSALVDDVAVSRRRAIETAIEDGDAEALTLAGRLDAILAAAAHHADAPDRRLDPVLDRLAGAAGAYVEHSWGSVGGAAASAGIQEAADQAADELAGAPGSAGDELRRQHTEAERVLAVAKALPDQIVWAGSGVSGPAELSAAAVSDDGDRVLEQWTLAQGPAVRRELARLRSAYAAGADLTS